MVEIYDEDTLTEFELNRQRNIIKNFEFMKACGLPVKPLIYVKRVHVPLEEQFKYLSDESSDSSDEEWTLGPKKKKKDKNEPKSSDIRIKVSNPTEFFKQKKKREEEEAKNAEKEEGESSKTQVTKKRKRRSKKKVEDQAQPSTSGTSSSSSSSASKSSTKPTQNVASQASQTSESDAGASAVKVTAVKEKANGKHFIKERPKLPPSTLKRNKNIDSSSSDEDNDNDEDLELADIPVVEPELPEIPTEAAPCRYPKREGQPRVNYSEAEVPDDDHYLFCAECNLYYQGECSKHLPIRPISDSTPSEGSLKARSTLPEGMEIKRSSIKDAGLGVFSTMAFKSGATFGPYAGEKIRADVPKVGLDTSYMWEIVKDLKVVYYVNGKNEEFANWMRYVNCSRNEEEQNMIAYQFHGKIFYRVYKDVEAGTEFLVWYGEEYAGELGIALEEKPENTGQRNGQTFKCDWCLICYALQKDLLKHLKYCSKRPVKAIISSNGNKPEPSIYGSSGTVDHESKKTHQCPVCDKSFNHKHHLTDHFRVHTGDRPFSCQQCGKKFNQQSALTRHMRTHTQEQPFKCEVCGHQCGKADNMRVHMRVHTGERPYKCVVCGKGFTQATHLKNHSRTHTGEKPHHCPYCEFKFSQKSQLNRHVKTQHPNEED